jgi:uncharacterized protein (TIGR00661 family)
MKKDKKILVAPLDWGIGHASRCAPVIGMLKQKGAHVIIGSSGRSAAFLKAEFPDTDHIDLPGFEISYPHHGSMSLRLLRRSPVILSATHREHRQLENLIEDLGIDAVISDNRFGLWSSKAYSIYITHQVSIKAPSGWSFTEGLLYMVHRRYIAHYNECWIPDLDEDDGLSGELAHKRKCPVPTSFIGPLSRFEPPEGSLPEKKYDVMAIVSGPEPQRSILEGLLLAQLKASDMRSMLVQGKPEETEHRNVGNVDIHSHLKSQELRNAILASGTIICRPGYSSIMDLSVLGKQAIFIPTPGQTEQEYLATFHKQKHHYYSISQDQFVLEKSLQAARNYSGIKLDHNTDLLDAKIDELLSRL